MAGLNGVSAYQQTSRTWQGTARGAERATAARGSEQSESLKESAYSKTEIKSWSPIDVGSSLVPRQTEYGNTIGDVQLSDKAKDYYGQLKSKFGNMEFIAVSKDMKSQVQQRAASYGNANKMVVLIDEEKLERMANDESYRKKYEGIIAMSQNKLIAAKNSLASTGANVKNFGMSVDSDGNESFFATVEKSGELQKKRIEEKAAAKKEEKAKEKKKAEKKAFKERIEKAREKRKEKAEKAEDADDTDKTEKTGKAEEADNTEKADDKEYVTYEADSIEALLSRISAHSFNLSSGRVRTEAELTVGTQVDYKG